MKVPEKVKAEESAALARLIATRWPRGMTRKEFARLHKVRGGESMISQHLSGTRPISLNAAIAYCRAFGVPLRTLSPRLAEVVSRAGSADNSPAPVKNVTSLRPDWPFPRVDERVVASLRERQLKVLEAALFDAAEEMGISIRKRQSA